MLEKELLLTVEKRVGALVEFNRRKEEEATSKLRVGKPKPSITLSREYGCEAIPVAELLVDLLEKKTGDKWLVMDKVLFQEVARNHSLSEEIVQKLGEKPSWLDEMIASFSPKWKSDKDCFQLLMRQIVAMASAGNVILMGRGSAFVTQSLKNCKHFRLYGSEGFKIRYISKHLGISPDQARDRIIEEQRKRDQFIRTFLDRDAHDLTPYNLLFNNDLNSSEKIAHTIADYMMDY